MPIQTPNPAYGAHLLAYAGLSTFMRQEAARDLGPGDVAIVGVPFDSGAVSFRSGARLGPRAIRQASPLLWGYHGIWRVAPLDVLRVVDYGDVAVAPTDIVATLARIQQEVGAVLAAGATVLTLGGDHSISLPLLRAHAALHGPLALVHFDAHADTWAGPYDHATPFRHAAEEGLIDPAAWAMVGIRGPLWGPEDIVAPEKLGARVYRIDECMERGAHAVMSEVRQRIGVRPVYVSLDLDAADPAYAPGVGTPEVGGLTSYQLLQFVRGLRGLNLVGFDLVELCPAYDAAEITAILAANLAFEFLALLAAPRSQTLAGS